MAINNNARNMNHALRFFIDASLVIRYYVFTSFDYASLRLIYNGGMETE